MTDFGGASRVEGDQINQSGDNAIGKVQFGRRGKALKTVLMLLSNPVDTPTLRLDQEYKAVDDAIQLAAHRDQIDLRTGMALRYPDLQTLLLRYKPAIVHYAGHSNRDGIALADHNGRAQAVPPRALEQLFQIIGRTVTCVVLNSCLSDRQAESIAKHVPCVVGLTNRIADPVAIDFAAGFHQAIASGMCIGDAFELGRNLPALGGLNNDGPKLFRRTRNAPSLTVTR